jgi:sulfide:quinone oxidoreductase
MRSASTVRPVHIVIAGGGIAAIELLMALADLGDGRLRLEVVSATDSFVLLPQAVGAPWGGPAMHVDLERLCRGFGARFRRGEVAGVDRRKRHVLLADGSRLGYQELVMATGARVEAAYPGVDVLGCGPLAASLALPGGGDVAVVVPPGRRWTLPAYELALLIAGPPGRRGAEVVTWEHEPLEVFGPGATRSAEEFLRSAGVRLSPGRPLPPGSDVSALADVVVALPLTEGPAVSGLPCDQDGFLPVDGRMALLGADSVHAIGDVTSGTIKQGGLAAQQADVAAVDLVNGAGGSLAPIVYAPVLRGRLTKAEGHGLYLRRALNASDAGTASSSPLWQTPGVVSARRLSQWLASVPGVLYACGTDHVARAGAVHA